MTKQTYLIYAVAAACYFAIGYMMYPGSGFLP